jgi:ethanolamine utilization cobalamin adenosyltransferase
MEQPGNINITPINRAFLQEQGILKGMGSQIKKRKMQKKPMQPKPAKKMYSEKEVKAGMAKSLDQMRKERMKKGGPSSLSEWPVTPKGLYKKK